MSMSYCGFIFLWWQRHYVLEYNFNITNIVKICWVGPQWWWWTADICAEGSGSFIKGTFQKQVKMLFIYLIIYLLFVIVTSLGVGDYNQHLLLYGFMFLLQW